MNDINIFTGLIGLVSIMISGWLTLRGKREEVAAKRTDDLINRQGEQIERQGEQLERQEARVDKLEQQVAQLRLEADKAREEARIADHDRLKAVSAMNDLVNIARTVDQWIAAGYPPPPPDIDLRAIEKVQMDLARPRRPPDAL